MLPVCLFARHIVEIMARTTHLAILLFRGRFSYYDDFEWHKDRQLAVISISKPVISRVTALIASRFAVYNLNLHWNATKKHLAKNSLIQQLRLSTNCSHSELVCSIQTRNFGHLNVLLVPASARLSRLASEAALFAAATAGFAFALFSFAFTFFSAAFSPDDLAAWAIFAGILSLPANPAKIRVRLRRRQVASVIYLVCTCLSMVYWIG